MTLHAELVTPEGAIWSGDAGMVIAKTLEGDIGVLTGRAPVLGILAEGSLVRIRPESEGQERDWVVAAVGGGFFSVADNRVSILARQAQLGSTVDRPAVTAALEDALQYGEAPAGGEVGDSADVRYLRALLTASGDAAGQA